MQWNKLTTIPDMVDSFPEKVDFVRIRLTFSTERVVFIRDWLTLSPHTGLRPLLIMGFCWNLVSDAPVRPVLVVEADEGGYALRCVFYGLEATLPVDHLCLQDAIHTLCNGIVRRLVVLGHADAYLMLLQSLDVLVAAILHTSVGVVDEMAHLLFRGLFYSHLQGLHGVLPQVCQTGTSRRFSVNMHLSRDEGSSTHPQGQCR